MQVYYTNKMVIPLTLRSGTILYQRRGEMTEQSTNATTINVAEIICTLHSYAGYKTLIS